MNAQNGGITPAMIRFFRDLGRHNSKIWMDANRDRYRAEVVEPLRALLAALAPAVLKLNPGFDTAGRTGVNFSRINRDIRFAKDKTPYRTQMYVTFPDPSEGDAMTAQLYVGVSAESITAGFRTYSGGSAKSSPLLQRVRPRIAQNPQWFARQKKRLARGYESYWYTTEKGEWTKHNGWPVEAADWKKLQGWVVRRKFPPRTVSRPAFVSGVADLFRKVYPLFAFVTSLQWKP